MKKHALGGGGLVRYPLALAILLAACGGDDTGDLTVAVTFPSASAEMNTGTLHVWVLREIVRDEEPPAGGGERTPLVTCARLVGGIVDPYDLNVERRADAVYFMPLAGNTATVAAVQSGDALVYVEGVDQVGRIHLSGCAEGSVPGSVTVALVPAGVFDCADSATEDGAPCDDGAICTVDEACNNGRCGGGVPLDCTFVSDACHGSNCVEGTGCVPVPLPNGEPCDDALYCTVNDVCDDGVCRGAPRDCRTQLGSGPCEIATCDEAFDFCDENIAPADTICDDSNMCTTTSSCTSFGSCFGSQDVTCPVADACNFQSFCYPAEGCRPSPRSGTTIYCSDSDPCTEVYPYVSTTFGAGVDTCGAYDPTMVRVCSPGRLKDRDNDGYVDQACTLTNRDCDDNSAAAYPGAAETPATGTTCSDGLDNDCDGKSDCNDLACCGMGVCGASSAENTISACADLRDNDCDGNIDCADSNCSGVGTCP